MIKNITLWFETLSLGWGIALSWTGAVLLGAGLGLLGAWLCDKENKKQEEQHDK